MAGHGSDHAAAVREILLLLGGLPGLRLWPVTQGVARPLNSPRAVRRFGTISGAADLSGIIGVASADGAHSPGRRLEIEVKTGSGRPSARQRAYLDTMRRFGAVAFVAGSAEDALRELARADYPSWVLTRPPSQV